MVNIGDTVLVTIPTYLTSGFGAAARLQARLRQAGLAVGRVDESGLPWMGVLSGRGELLVTVTASSSAFGSVNDVAALVAGAAYAEGYDINAGSSARVVAQGQQQTSNYNALQNAGDNTNNKTDNLAKDIGKTLGLSTEVLIIGAMAIFAVMIISGKK